MFRPNRRVQVTNSSNASPEAPKPPTQRLSLQDFKQLRQLFGFTRPYRLSLVIGMVAVSIASLLGLVFPAIVRNLFNTAFLAEAEVSRLNGIALSLFIVFVIQAGFNFLRVYHLARVGEGVVADLRRRVYAHLMTLPVTFFEARKTGEITSRLTSDIATVQGVVSQALAQLINQSITLIGGSIYLFILNWKLTLIMLAVIPAVILSGAYFGRRLRRLSTSFQDSVADANASAEEAISNIRVVKSFTAEAYETVRYDGRIQSSFELALKRARVRALFIPSIILAMFSGVSIVLWYGGRLVITGGLPAGDLIAFLMLTIFVAGSIGTFTGLYSQLQEALGASKRIFDLLAEKSDLPKTDTPAPLPAAEGDVVFHQVSFQYQDRPEAWGLKEIDISVRLGEIIALVGPSGAGKSTMVNLIPRFYDVTKGHLLVGGTDVQQVALSELRQQIGIVPQETQLFSGTIAENIRYGRLGATGQEVVAAAQAANAHSFIEGFPEEYQTVVGERGIKLSGGQRQRIAIARALLKNPRILILDEATSALDSESEALVQEALAHLMKGRTTFVIAHRLATVRNADRILVLDQGRIVQQGTHEELSAQKGLYKELSQKQFHLEPAVAL